VQAGLDGTPADAAVRPGSATSAVLVATDARGRTLRLPGPAQRIVSLAPHVTELVFAAGAGSRLVAVAQWSDFPQAARKLPPIGGAGRLDVERIHALAPDLIIGWQSGDPAADVALLESLGHRVFQTESRRLADIAPLLREIGRLAGTAPIAEREAIRMEQALTALRRDPGTRPTLFYQIWDSPLMTVSDRHFIGDAIALCGARNVFGSLPGLTPTVSTEAVLNVDPQLIVASGTGDPRALSGWQRFGHLRAVETGRLYQIDPDLLHRPTPRIVEGVRALCSAVERAGRVGRATSGARLGNGAG